MYDKKAVAKKKEGPKKKNFFLKHWPVWIVLAAGIAIIVGAIVYYSLPLDEIQSYEVHVQVNADGTLTDTYHIQWKVLNDSREGPLSWVTAGMPNRNYNIVSYGGAAYAASNTQDGYINIVLDTSYYQNDVADFTYTVTQRDMLCVSDEEAAPYMIDFAPGWFPKIKIDSYRFTMSPASPAVGGNQDSTDGDTLVWAGSLKPNGHREMKVYYTAAAFAGEPDTVSWSPIDYSNAADNGGGSTDYSPLIALFVVIVMVVFVLRMIGRGGYGGGRGFFGGYYGGVYPGGFGGGFGGGGGGCACACAGCACACACAGGGRAGCNTKDFYKPTTDAGTSVTQIEN